MLCSCEKLVFNFLMQALINNRLNGKLIKWLNKPIVKLQNGKVTNGLMEICSNINNFKEKQLVTLNFTSSYEQLVQWANQVSEEHNLERLYFDSKT